MNSPHPIGCTCDTCTSWAWAGIGPPTAQADYRRPGLPMQEETSPKPEDKTKKKYRLLRSAGYGWELWEKISTREVKWLTNREANGLNGKTFEESWFDADIRFKPENV